MLKLGATFENIPILSLRTGNAIATTQKIIFNPHNLKVEGWYVVDNVDKTILILISNDVREIIDRGIVINDHEVLSPKKELIRLREVIDLNFELLGKNVVTDSGRKVGKVVDFAIETNNFFVKKIYASQPLLKNFTGGTLSIDRSQIVEITNKKIVVEDTAILVKDAVPAPSLSS